MARQIIVDIIGDSKKLGTAFTEASGHASKFGGIMTGISMGVGMGMFNLVEDGVKKVIDVFKDANKAALETEASQALLGQSLKNNVPKWNGNTAAIDKAIASGHNLGFATIEQTDALAKLVGITHDVGKANNMMVLAEELARAKHLDLATATSDVTKALNGNFKAFKTLGMEIPKGATAAQALNIIQKNVKGSAEAWADTNEGRLAISQVKVQAAMENLGGVINQITAVAIPALSEAVSGIIDAFSAWLAANQPLVDQIKTTLAGAIQFVSKTVLPTLVNVISGVIGRVGDFIRKNQPLIDQIKGALTTAIQFVTKTVIPNLTAAFKTVSDFITQKVLPPVQNIVSAIATALPGAIDKVRGYFDQFLGAIKPLIDTFKEFIGDSDAVKGALVILGGIVLYNVVPSIIAWAAAQWTLAAAVIATNLPIIAAIAGIAALVLILEKLGILKIIGQWFDDIVGVLQQNLGPAFAFITGTVIPDVVSAFQTLVGIVMGIPGAIEALPGEIGGLIASIPDVISQAIASIPGLISAAIQLWVNLFIGIPLMLLDLTTSLPAKFADIFAMILPKATGAVGGAGSGIVGAFLSIPGKIVGLVTSIPGVFTDIARNAVDKITNPKTGLVALAVAAITGLPGKLGDIGGTIVGILVGAFTGIGGKITTAASGMWDGIWQAFRQAINRIIKGWNDLKFTLPSFNGPFGITVGGFTIGTPNLPYLHQGGIVPGTPGSDVMAILQAGERVTRASDAGRGGDIHIHIDQGAYIDGPSVDRLATLITQRLRYATGL